MKTTSEAGRAVLVEREGKVNRAYPDPNTGGDPWTIGVGHTGPEVHPGLVWTDAQIADALHRDLDRFERAVNGCVRVPLTQNQFDALVSFSHNCGENALPHGGAGGGPATLLRKLNASDYAGASKCFRDWIIPRMIISRRAGEWAQFNTPDGHPYPATSQFDARFP